jgi:hypothetical protein
MVSADHSASEDVDCHSATSSSCTRGTGHDSTDWVVPETFAGSLAEDWCADEYDSQRPIPEASSSWPPFLFAYCR